MSEKRKPTHCLDSFKEEFSDENNLNFTRTALLSAFELGFSRFEIVEVIQTMEKEHFYKSMTSHANHKIWQDVYHVPSEQGVLYIKFTSDTVTDFSFLMLSFKEKENG
ncbi:MAG TPA: type II toxin-antitoxin system MqsR family toxin [Phycisphaerales bacterium]|nr:type II toxin-antitoxin system MqsR family toxin [Phycisphaerales bacterium]